MIVRITGFLNGCNPRVSKSIASLTDRKAEAQRRTGAWRKSLDTLCL
jgi:hypothetical protein